MVPRNSSFGEKMRREISAIERFMRCVFYSCLSCTGAAGGFGPVIPGLRVECAVRVILLAAYYSRLLVTADAQQNAFTTSMEMLVFSYCRTYYWQRIRSAWH